MLSSSEASRPFLGLYPGGAGARAPGLTRSRSDGWLRLACLSRGRPRPRLFGNEHFAILREPIWATETPQCRTALISFSWSHGASPEHDAPSLPAKWSFKPLRTTTRYIWSSHRDLYSSLHGGDRRRGVLNTVASLGLSPELRIRWAASSGQWTIPRLRCLFVIYSTGWYRSRGSTKRRKWHPYQTS